jgi:hypothetical protein
LIAGKVGHAREHLAPAPGATDLWWTFNVHNARLRAKTDALERETRQTRLAAGAEGIRIFGGVLAAMERVRALPSAERGQFLIGDYGTVYRPQRRSKEGADGRNGTPYLSAEAIRRRLMKPLTGIGQLSEGL